MASADFAEFIGTARFRVLHRLGAGGMGVVYEVEDRLRDASVALKTLRAVSPDALLRFKNEFRSLQEIHHPNLVSLYELHQDGGQWFFTMELVRGVSFLAHVRPGDDSSSRDTVVDAASSPEPTWIGAGHTSGTFVEERLRAGLHDLATGLAALHAAGMIHRDIKPGNIVVTPEGRLVLLDFGLVADVGRDAVETRAIGTAAYMAPEQAGALQVGPPADWYSVGVLLYEALTGRLPFIGSPEDVLADKQHRVPAPPSAHSAGLPADLEALCMDLLRPDPATRPREQEILRRLGVHPGTRELAAAAPLFVGRRGELAALHDAFRDSARGRPVTVLLRGESGVGKSALVRHFLELLVEEEEDVVILTGHCYERESVPYKGVDGMIDALSRQLRRVPAGESQESLVLLGEVFPVLRRGDRPAPPVRDPQELRARVFDSLRRLLALLARRAPLVVAIDDLQWADLDSLALLADVLRPGPEAPALLFVASILREPVELPGDVRTIDVGNLPAQDGRELARLLLTNARRRPTDLATSEAIAAEASGHPLYIDELVRRELGGQAGLLRLDDALWSRVTAAPATARALLEAIVVAGEPLAIDVAAATLARPPAEIAAIAATLGAAQLARTTPAGAIEPYHDKVREAVLAHLTVDEQRAWHRRLAGALEASGRADPEALALHLRDSGERERAAHFAALAAEQASAALAFARAARLYRIALNLGPTGGPEAQTRRLQLAQALVNAGHLGEAAEVYLSAVPHAPPENALDLQRRAAEQLLRSGRIDEGVATMQEVLAGVHLKLPKTPQRALASLLVRRAQLRLRGIKFRERESSALSATERARLEVCWSVGASLGIFDTIRGADFQTRHLLLALDAGDPRHIALALAVEAAYSASGGVGNHRRTARLVEASSRLADKIQDDHAIGAARLCAGMAAYLEGRFASAREMCDEAEIILRERCSGVAWETFTAQLFGLWSLALSGDVRELTRRLELGRKQARERGDLNAMTNLRIGLPMLATLAADDPLRARSEAREAIGQWSKADFLNQHAFFIFGEGEVDLYLGEPQAALDRLREAWPTLRSTVLQHIQITRIECHHLRGRAALMLAASQEPERLLAEAEGDARRLLREQVPYAQGLANLLLAGVYAMREKGAEAAAYLDRAIEGLAGTGMHLHAAAARRQRARLEPIVEDDAPGWMRAQGVANPERLVASLAPGFR